MKLHALCASAVALTLAYSSPVKAGAETDFVGLFVISMGVSIHCPNIEVVEGGAERYADSHGADFDRFGQAAGNAMKAISGGDYDHEKLIPEVTQYVRNAMIELGADVQKLGKPRFCKKWLPLATGNGFMRITTNAR